MKLQLTVDDESNNERLQHREARPSERKKFYLGYVRIRSSTFVILSIAFYRSYSVILWKMFSGFFYSLSSF